VTGAAAAAMADAFWCSALVSAVSPMIPNTTDAAVAPMAAATLA